MFLKINIVGAREVFSVDLKDPSLACCAYSCFFFFFLFPLVLPARWITGSLSRPPDLILLLAASYFMQGGNSLNGLREF